MRHRGLTSSSSYEEEWPRCRDEAFAGPAGVVARTIEPHSEADPGAIPIQTIVGDLSRLAQRLRSAYHLAVTLLRLGCAMRRVGGSVEAIEAALLAENQHCCDPPKEERLVCALARDITDRYEPKESR